MLIYQEISYTVPEGLEPTQVTDVYKRAVDWAIPIGITFIGFCLAVLLISFLLSKF